MRVFQDLQRRLGVALPRRLVQYAGDFHLAVSAPLLFRHFRQRIEFAKLPILRRTHSGSQRQRVALQAITRCPIDCVKPRLSCLKLARFVGKRVPCHVRHFIFKKNCLQSLRDRDRAAAGPTPPLDFPRLLFLGQGRAEGEGKGRGRGGEGEGKGRAWGLGLLGYAPGVAHCVLRSPGARLALPGVPVALAWC